MNVFLNIPYPNIDNAVNNINFGYSLYDSYSGIVSELSAITTYSYQSFILPKKIKKIFEEISIVEMKHLEILANLICKSGLTPYYIYYSNNMPIPWNSEFAYYNTNYISMLKYNINSEYKAIDGYKKLLKLTNNIETIEMINRIILDEENHIKIFTNLLENTKN